MPAKSVKIIPLGGLGEIGLNMMALEQDQNIIVIDAGSMFPEDYMMGIDLVIPDHRYLCDNMEKILAVILTHGHEDHIGAIPYILKNLNIPIYGTPMTLGLLKEKLLEHKLLDQALLKTIHPREKLELGPFCIEFIGVNHSIIGGVALGIETSQGIILHSGDFKFDPTPMDGGNLDYYMFAHYGERGVRLLLSDSTNVEKMGYSPSEKDVGQYLARIFKDAKGRVIITTFSSSVFRIQQIIDLVQSLGRKLYLNGRSMLTNVRIAGELGYLKVPEDLFIDHNGLTKTPKEEVVVLTTGSQGEPMSALSLMAAGEHKYIKIEKDDTVIFSSRFIPGHEKAINSIINRLYKKGADVIYEKISEVHVSGHANQEELKWMLNLTRPDYFIPIHGEYRHLVQHAKLANKVGIPQSHVILAENGDIVELGDEGARKAGRVESGRIFVDGKGVGDIGSTVLRDRQHLSVDGMVVALLVTNKQTGETISGPDIFSRGFVFEEESGELLDEAKSVIVEHLEKARLEPKTEEVDIKVEIRRVLKSFFNRTIRRKPIILPIIVEI